jgi:hypothetical protein
LAEAPQTIAEINDAFRRAEPGIPGKTVLTVGITGLLREQEIPLPKLAQRVANYSEFTEDNDPHGEHDFGAFEIGGTKCFWKIDAYDLDYQFGSEDPLDLTITNRVLTIMLADEW